MQAPHYDKLGAMLSRSKVYGAKSISINSSNPRAAKSKSINNIQKIDMPKPELPEQLVQRVQNQIKSNMRRHTKSTNNVRSRLPANMEKVGKSDQPIPNNASLPNNSKAYYLKIPS